jgi:hypothetical protein
MLHATQGGLRAAVTTLAVSAVLASATAARAGNVAGKLDLPASGPPPLRDPGFLDRVENPHMPIRAADATPLLVVVLVPAQGSAPAPAGAPKQASATMQFLGGSFDKPLVAVMPGTEITIKSCAACPDANLAADGKPDLIEKAVLSGNGSKVFKVTEPGAIVIKDQMSAGLRGYVAVFDTPYFVQPGADGHFELKDVAPGTYTLRVWYADHFVQRGDETVTVEGKRSPPELPHVPIPTGFPAAQGK